MSRMHFVLWFHEQLFMCVTARDQDELENWILDWCKKHKIKPKAKEWLIKDIEHVEI